MVLTLLDALLVFLVGHNGQSGYDIRQLFQATPLGVFSDSPGSIYPSLARLEARGLLASAGEDGGRRRRSYSRTAAGTKALNAWLALPIDGSRKLKQAEIELRFVMIAEMRGWAAAAAFLENAEAFFVRELKALEAFMAGPGREMSQASRAAVDLGMRTCRVRIQWCRDIRKQKEKA